jgi:predicted AAA+ superfamily ATPase
LESYAKEQFKLYMVDEGLLSAKSGLSLQTRRASLTRSFSINSRGGTPLTEQFVLQELKSLPLNTDIFYTRLMTRLKA